MLAGYDGALVFRHKAASIVSVPHTVPEIERSTLRRASPAEVCDPSFLSRTFMVRKGAIVGPCDLSVADRSSFVPPKSRAYPISWERYRAMHVPWATSQHGSEPWTLFGIKAGLSDAFVGYVPAGGKVAMLSLFEDLNCLGEIWARKLLGTAMADAFEKGLVPVWRTGSKYDPIFDEMKRSLGFRTYATTMDVQLLEDEF
jgi:hypothetical protein